MFLVAYVIGVVCMLPAMVYDSMFVPPPRRLICARWCPPVPTYAHSRWFTPLVYQVWDVCRRDLWRRHRIGHIYTGFEHWKYPGVLGGQVHIPGRRRGLFVWKVPKMGAVKRGVERPRKLQAHRFAAIVPHCPVVCIGWACAARSRLGARGQALAHSLARPRSPGTSSTISFRSRMFSSKRMRWRRFSPSCRTLSYSCVLTPTGGDPRCRSSVATPMSSPFRSARLQVYMGSMARNLASIVTGDLEIDVRYTLAVAIVSGIALGCLVWYAAIDRVSHPHPRHSLAIVRRSGTSTASPGERWDKL